MPPGWPDVKTRSPSFEPLGENLQVVLDLRGLVVLVHAEHRDVEVVARVREVVGVAAEERDAVLRREHQAHVRVLLVAIQVVEAALVERDDGALQPGGVGRLLLDLGDRGAARGERIGLRRAALDGAVDAGRHVLDALQDVQLHRRDLQFVGAGLREEPVLDQVALGRAELLHRARARRGGSSARGRRATRTSRTRRRSGSTTAARGSSHSSVTSKPYAFLMAALGTALYGQKPSSARGAAVAPTRSRMAAPASRARNDMVMTP